MANTDRYKRICTALLVALTEAYISFCAYSTTKFEDFLLQFQSDEPRIHLLYSSMGKLISNLQPNFICKMLLSGMNSENLFVDICFKKNRKALQFLDIGTKAKSILHKHTHQLKIAQDKLDKLKKNCLNFYMSPLTHRLDRLTFLRTSHKACSISSTLKRNDSDATNAISNLSLCMMSVLTNKLSEVFHIQSPIISEDMCDKIRTQWMRLQMEPLQDEWFKNPLKQIDSGTSDCNVQCSKATGC